jgi:DNA topoisomerase I
MSKQVSSRRAARALGLRYVPAKALCIVRKATGNGFTYINGSGRPLREGPIVRRIRELAIPPAWKDVRIAADETAHLQAIGRDEAGRVQYRYHERWRELRELRKAERLAVFARALPVIRAAVRRDLEAEVGSPELALAAGVRLIDETVIRVGDERHFRRTGARGAATLRPSHVRVQPGNVVALKFRAKGGKDFEAEFRSKSLARAVKRLRSLGGKRLLAYRGDDGALTSVTARALNDYLARISGEKISAKDFRTFHATALAGEMLASLEPGPNERKRKSQIVAVTREVAGVLGNTLAVARESYVHDLVLTSFENGKLRVKWRRSGRARKGLSPHESALARLLKA